VNYAVLPAHPVRGEACCDMLLGMTFLPRLVLVLGLLGAALPLRADGPAPSTWKQVDDDDGIRTWQMSVPGQEVPSFRGQAVIDASADAIRHVIEDVARHPEWMEHCVDAKLIAQTSSDTSIIYNRTGAPWPVWDRDAVLSTRFAWDAAHKVLTLTFENTDPKRAAVPDRTVRMPRLIGFYRMEVLGPQQTRVTYQVQADVGGSLPTWLAKRVAKDMPYNTLDRLRARVTGKKN